MTELDQIKKILERERLARKEAERILEVKSLEVYEKGKEIENLNITLKKQAEKELEIIARKQDLLDGLFRTHPLPIIIISVDTYMLVEINNEAAMMFGIERQNLQNIELADLCHLKKLKGREANESEIEKISVMQRLNGEKISVKIRKIKTLHKGATAFLLIIEDISELIEQKKQSEEQIKLLSLFPELNPFPVLRFSIGQNQLLYANKIGTEFLDGLEHDKDQKRDWLLFLDGKAGVFQEVEWQNKTYRFRRIAFEEYGFINFYSTDITENVNNQKALLKKDQELEEAKRLSLIGEFAAGIAHEINNPLAVIHAKTQLLEMQLAQLNFEKTESSEKIMDSLEAIRRMTLHTSDLIKNLKTFSSKANFEKLDLVTLTDVIDMVLNISEKRCSNVGIKIASNVDPNVKLICSPSGLAQVILNLVSNSIDAIESQKDKWITIESNISSQTLKIIITDSGSGIPDEIVKKITQPFFSTKDPGKGTGLGLSISLKTIEKMKGQLYYNSKSENTQFIIEFKSFEV